MGSEMCIRDRSCTEPQAQHAALDTQRAILKQLRAERPDLASSDANPNDFVEEAVLCNLEKESATREWIDLQDALQGPAHVAKVLIRRCQEKRSQPNKLQTQRGTAGMRGPLCEKTGAWVSEAT